MNFNQPPFAADLTVDQVFACIRSGVNLDQLAFREGNITYWNLWNIDRNINPHLYTKSSNGVDDNYEQPFHKELENRDEEEEEEILLPILGTLLTWESEQCLNEQSFENMNNELERHLGKHLEMEIEEALWEREQHQS